MYQLATVKSIPEIYSEGASGLWHDLTHFHSQNYLHWLIYISLFVFLLELAFPWRKDQKKFRRDFWLDALYMFFNIFIFINFFFKVIAEYAYELFIHLINAVNLEFLLADRVGGLPVWLQLVILFIVRDFIQWNVHRLLHRSDTLWNFHKVHHSVKEMGFAAHLRFHWMETLIYNTLQFLPLAMIGFALNDYITVYIIAILIGHLNHANIKFSYGPLKYIFNNPHMHIWHHFKNLPDEHRYGCNFGLSLSIWDYMFGTAYIPKDGRDIEIGYKGDEDMPQNFFKQLIFGFTKR